MNESQMKDIIAYLTEDELRYLKDNINKKLNDIEDTHVFYVRFYAGLHISEGKRSYICNVVDFTSPDETMRNGKGPTHKVLCDKNSGEFISIEPIEYSQKLSLYSKRTW